jgi:hypothetical protein
MNVTVKGKDRWTLFDSGAENTYAAAGVAAGLESTNLEETKTTRLGGKKHTVRQACVLRARVDGKKVEVPGTYVVDFIGADKQAKRDFEVLFGARAMQDWGIELDLKQERVDLSGYPGESVEF